MCEDSTGGQTAGGAVDGPGDTAALLGGLGGTISSALLLFLLGLECRASSERPGHTNTDLSIRSHDHGDFMMTIYCTF